MSTITFSNRLKLWWEATRILAGQSTVPLLLETIQQHNMLPKPQDYQRWLMWRGSEDQGDPRVWMAHGFYADISIAYGKNYPNLLAYALFDQGTSDLKSWAASRWTFLYETLPSHYEMAWRDGVLSLHENFKSLKKETLEDLDQKSLSSTQLKWLMAWSMVSKDDKLQNHLFPRLARSEWERGWDVLDQNFSWVHWAIIANHASAIKKAISEGFSLAENLNIRGGLQERCQDVAKKIQKKSLSLDLPKSALLKKFNNHDPLKSLAHYCSPIYRAVEVGQDEVLAVLVKQGLDMKKEVDECTPLRYALRQNRWSFAKILADHHAPLFEKDDEFYTVSWLAGKEFSTLEDQEIFEKAMDSLFKNVLAPNPKWNPENKDYIATVNACVNNPDVSPTLLQGLFDTCRKKSLINISCHYSNDTTRWTLGAFACAVHLRNEAFVEACAKNKHIAANTTWSDKMSVLPLVIYFTPKALPALLSYSSPQDIQNALDKKLEKFSLCGWNYPWNDFSLEKIILRASKPAEIFQAFKNNPTTEAWLNRLSRDSWINGALSVNNVAVVKAITETMGQPNWDEGVVLTGLNKTFTAPFNEGMIQYMFDQSWSMNVLLNKEGLSPLWVALDNKKWDWAEKMIKFGADINRKGPSGLSVQEYLDQHQDQEFASKAKAALAKGSSALLQHTTPELVLSSHRPARL